MLDKRRPVLNAGAEAIWKYMKLLGDIIESILGWCFLQQARRQTAALQHRSLGHWIFNPAESRRLPTGEFA